MWMVSFAEETPDNLRNPKGKQGMKKIDRLVPRESWNSSNIYQETSRGLLSRWSLDIGKFYYPEKWNVCP